MANRGEEIEQARLIKWSHKASVRAVLPCLKFLHHSPNGGKRDAFTGAQMKALGVKPGFPDLVLPVLQPAPAKGNGLAIEMKSATGRQSPEQKEWQAHLESQGWQYSLARSAQEAREIVCQYLDMPLASLPDLDA